MNAEYAAGQAAFRTSVTALGQSLTPDALRTFVAQNVLRVGDPRHGDARMSGASDAAAEWLRQEAAERRTAARRAGWAEHRRMQREG